MAADRQLFEEELRTLYGAHHQAAEQAAANRDASTLPKLKHMQHAGSKANLDRAARLERVFTMLGVTPFRRHDAALQGIVEANNDLIAKNHGPIERDLINIEYGQITAHFFIAKYGTLRNYAWALGHRKAAHLLEKTLDEIRHVDREFTRLADRLVRRPASARYSHEMALTTTAAMHPAIATSVVLGGIVGAIALLDAIGSKAR